jgi:outer membrane lipoprotein-sorting protein
MSDSAAGLRSRKLEGLVLLAILTFAGSSASPVRQSVESSRAREIVDRVDRMLRGDSSVGTVTMSVVTRRWTRSMKLAIWSEGTEKVLIRVMEPEKEKGTATLKVGSDMWNYLPKIDRTIRIPASMMMASWMGSHFTNDDLVKESRLIRDYDIAISFEGERDSVPVYEFLLTPRPEAAVVWGKILMQVRREDLMPTWSKYYAEDGRLVREMKFSGYRRMGGRVVPAIMRITPEKDPGEHTEIRYDDLEFDVAIPERTFSLAALRK